MIIKKDTDFVIRFVCNKSDIPNTIRENDKIARKRTEIKLL